MIAIIPARSGSKRIPQKNIKPFLGKPIIAYSIEKAISSNLFDDVMVSTDDERIGDIAKSYGASVPFLRSAKNADDYATTADVIVEVIKDYRKLEKGFDIGCCIYATAALFKVDKLKEALTLLREKRFSTTFPIVKYSYPISRSLAYKKSGQVQMNYEEFESSRSQDLPDSHHDAGQFYWFNVEDILKEKKLFTSNSGSIILNEFEVQDIDTKEDWKMAELKYQMLND